MGEGRGMGMMGSGGIGGGDEDKDEDTGSMHRSHRGPEGRHPHADQPARLVGPETAAIRYFRLLSRRAGGLGRRRKAPLARSNHRKAVYSPHIQLEVAGLGL